MLKRRRNTDHRGVTHSVTQTLSRRRRRRRTCPAPTRPSHGRLASVITQTRFLGPCVAQRKRNRGAGGSSTCGGELAERLCGPSCDSGTFKDVSERVNGAARGGEREERDGSFHTEACAYLEGALQNSQPGQQRPLRPSGDSPLGAKCSRSESQQREC